MRHSAGLKPPRLLGREDQSVRGPPRMDSDGTVNIQTGLADVGGRTGENDIGKLGEGG